MSGPGFIWPDLCSIRAVTEQEESADAVRGLLSADRRVPTGRRCPARRRVPGDQPSRSAGGGRTMTAVAAPSGGYRATAASGIDRAIRLSTAAAVLAMAGIAAYVSYWHAYAVVQAHGESGITARLEPATIDGLVYASDGRPVRGTAPGTGTAPGPLAARAGHRGHPHGEHGPGLVTRSRRSGGRGLASGQPRGLLRTPGLAHPHLRDAGTRATGRAPLRKHGLPRAARSAPAATADSGQHSRNDCDLSAQGRRPTGQPPGSRPPRPGGSMVTRFLKAMPVMAQRWPRTGSA